LTASTFSSHLISSHLILLHVISCHLVSFHRKLFLNPAPGYDPYSDPLSMEGCSRLYR
jgi:hypothetical protein